MRPARSRVPSETFADLDASGAVVSALEERGIARAFPVQSSSSPTPSRAATCSSSRRPGSAKTLAFGVPLVDPIEPEDPRPSALVLVPTRELAGQIVEEIRPLAHARALSIAAMYGGAGIERQIKLARRSHTS